MHNGISILYYSIKDQLAEAILVPREKEMRTCTRVQDAALMGSSTQDANYYRLTIRGPQITKKRLETYFPSSLPLVF